jgi:threonine dehydrogenase-like Zn-dependent dehydrogenase
MRAVVSHQGSVSLVERDLPFGEGELIRVTSSGICGSDLHLISLGLSGIVLGHEFGGYTESGQLVAVRPIGECGHCTECTRALPHMCAMAAASLHGTSIDGGLAEFVRVEKSRLVPVPGNVKPDAVALVEPLAVVVHGINRIPITSGMKAIVVGAGSIGLLAAAVLVDRGIEVDIVTRHPHQNLAAEALGARAVSTPSHNYDFSFDAVCTQQSFDACVSATRPRGSIVEFGMVWSPVGLSNTLMLKEISVIPSMFYSHDHEHHDFEEAVDVLSRNPHIAEALITHRYSLDDAAKAFDTANDRAGGAIKVHFFTN